MKACLPKGEEVYLTSCSGCHGHVGEGKVGPGLNDAYWTYPKNKTDKGLFETIFGGAQGMMGPHNDLQLDETAEGDGVDPSSLHRRCRRSRMADGGAEEGVHALQTAEAHASAEGGTKTDAGGGGMQGIRKLAEPASCGRRSGGER